MEVSEFDPLIVWFDGVLDTKFCKQVIRKFNKDDRTEDGVTGNGYEPHMKQSTDLSVSSLDEWKEEDTVFFECLTKHLKIYNDYAVEELGLYPSLHTDTGYQIQKTKPGGFYHWHHDFFGYNRYQYRTLTYIWYLNTPREGHTEFSCGESIKPKTGRLLLFPATWDRIHRGTPPETVKYICTGWMHNDEQDGTTPTE